MHAPPFDLAQAHRWFAIELNNRAWELAEKKQRSADETAEMLHAAHASTYHWSHAGTAINRIRALNLLATAYASAGQNESAWQYAQECAALLGRASDEATAFDHAASVGASAWIATLTGRRAEAAAMQSELEAKWGALPPEERAVLEAIYPRG